ncbi:MAG TPA: energy transducer TonB, partial [Xanthobacteraceae bacterium]
LRLWTASAVVVVGLHAAAGAMLVAWHDPIPMGEPSDAVLIDLSPFTTPASQTVEDIAPGPLQQEAAAQPEPEKPKEEEKVDEKVDVPPAPVPPIAALPPPEPITPEPMPTPVAPAPQTTAPPRAHASKAQVRSWYSSIVQQIERHKSYPDAARKRGETGEVELAFSIDREGHVLSSRIVKSSGHATLDEETLTTVRRAAPFPTPPNGLDGPKFDFTVPVKFNIR